MAYAVYKALIIDHTKCGASDTSNFVFKIIIPDTTYIDLRSAANGGIIQNTVVVNGLTVPADLGVFFDSGFITPLAYDSMAWDPVTGAFEANAPIALLTYSVDQIIYLAAGDAAVTTYQGGARGDAYSSNDKACLGFGDGTTLSLLDSTANANDGTVGGTMTAGAGLAGGGSVLGTNAGHIALPALYTMIGGSATHTESWLIKGTFFNNAVMLDGNTNGGVHGTLFQNGSATFYWSYDFSGGPFRQYATGGLYDDVLHLLHFVKTASGDNGDFYLDGVLQSVGTGSISDLFSSPAGSTYFMNWYADTLGVPDLCDEFRVRSNAISADQVTAENNNLRFPSTFFTITPATPPTPADPDFVTVIINT